MGAGKKIIQMEYLREVGTGLSGYHNLCVFIRIIH